jgi:putative ABC transport system permease protein
LSINVKIAWRNIWRNPRRTMLTIAAIAFACTLLVFMLSFQFGSYETMINASVKIHTGHLQIQAKGYNDNKDMQFVVNNPDIIARRLAHIPGIKTYAYRAGAFSLASSKERTYGIMAMGIEPEKEAAVSSLKQMIRQGDYLNERDSSGDTVWALVGSLLAKNLRVTLGDEVTLLGQGRDGSIAAAIVKIKGIYGSGIDDFDRSSIQIPLKNFQDIFFMQDAVHSIVITCPSLQDVSEVKNILNREINRNSGQHLLAVLDWDDLMPGLRQGIQLDLINGFVFYMLLILVVAFSILNTFLMAIFERTKEFGVMMAIGTKPNRLTRLLLLESAFITFFGIFFGIVLGISVTFFFQEKGIYFPDAAELLKKFGISGRIYPRLSLLSIFTGPVAVFIITLISALYPALKVRGLKPVEALTYD